MAVASTTGGGSGGESSVELSLFSEKRETEREKKKEVWVGLV